MRAALAAALLALGVAAASSEAPAGSATRIQSSGSIQFVVSHATPTVVRARWRSVHASLQWIDRAPQYVRRHLTLSYGRTTKQFDVNTLLGRIANLALQDPTWFRPGSSGVPPLLLRDLDGDGSPEAVLGFFTQGAHCCDVTLIVNRRGRPTVHMWDNYAEGYLRDVNGDGRLEFLSANGRFGYSLRYPEAFFPIQIWRYRRDRLVDATRAFPRAIAADARRFRRGFGGRWRPALDAYVADMCLLGRFGEAWAFARVSAKRGQLGRTPGRYLAGLRRYLRRARYPCY